MPEVRGDRHHERARAPHAPMQAAGTAAAEGEAVSAYRMPAPCANCPFNRTGAGAALRRSLRRGRWAEILRALRSDGHFMCHKTTRETGTGAELICAGLDGSRSVA